MYKFKIGDQVLLFNREKNQHEVGTVLARYKRQKIQRYDIQLERGIRMDYVSSNSENPFYVDKETTLKFFKQYK